MNILLLLLLLLLCTANDQRQTAILNYEIPTMWETTPRATLHKTSRQLMGPEQFTRPTSLQANYYYPCYYLHAGIYNYIPDTNRVSRVYNIAAVLYLQSVLHVILFRPWNTFCTSTLVVSVLCVQCPIWLFSFVGPWFRISLVCCSDIVWEIKK